MSTKYTLVINEKQRITLITAMHALEGAINLDEDESDIAPMLRQIVEDEAADPGTTHDFTL